MTRRDKNELLAALIVSVALIYAMPLFLSTPLLDPDEGIHASVAQEMVESGDLVVPHFLGTPFLDKPVLYTWTQALSLHCLGMNEAAVRLPGLAFALFGAWTTLLLARELFDQHVALIAGLISLTLFAPAILAQAATHDVAQVPWTNLMLLCLWRKRSASGWRRVRLVVATGLFTGLALLTKGLIGIALVSVGYWLFCLSCREISLSRIVRYAIVLLLGAVIAAPWYLGVEQQCPGYLYYYFVQRHVMGFATTTQLHAGEPWHYYLPILALGSFPWVVPAFLGFWASREPLQQPESHRIRFLGCWLLGGLLFLSAASSKLMTYCLPLFPAIGILAAYACERYMNGTSAAFQKWMTRTFQAAAVLGTLTPCLGMLALRQTLRIHISPVTWCGVGLVSLVGIISFVRQRADRRVAVVAGIPIWSAFIIAVVMAGPLQSISHRFSQRDLASHLSSLNPFPEQIDIAGERAASLVFYLQPEQRAALRGNVRLLPAWRMGLQRGSDAGATLIVTQKSRSETSISPSAPHDQVDRFLVFRTQPSLRVARQVRPPTVGRAP